jgi:hypothetical protein
MTRHRTFLPVLTLAVAAATAAAARADEVELSNGRVHVGRITEETTKTIRIELDSGSLTVARDDVKEIRRGPLPEKSAKPVQPAPAGPRIVGTPGDRNAGVAKGGAPSQPAAGMPGPDVEKLLAEFDRITLATWPEEVEEASRGDDPARPWRIARSDGSYEVRERAPEEAPGRRVWKLVRTGEGDRLFLLNGVVQMAWRPMYWDPVKREWTPQHPALRDFERDTHIAKRIAAAVANKDPKAWVECHVQRDLIARRQAGKVRNTTVNVVPERERMLSAAVRCTGSEPGGKDLVRYFEIDLDMEWATPADKIRLAVERREVLRRLASPQR